MKYKITIKTRHAESILPTIEPKEPILIDVLECDLFELEETKEKAKTIAMQYITDPQNEKTPGYVANNGYSITVEEIQ